MKRGEVWWADLGPYRNREQTGLEGTRCFVPDSVDALMRWAHRFLALVPAEIVKVGGEAREYFRIMTEWPLTLRSWQIGLRNRSPTASGGSGPGERRDLNWSD